MEHVLGRTFFPQELTQHHSMKKSKRSEEPCARTTLSKRHRHTGQWKAPLDCLI